MATQPGSSPSYIVDTAQRTVARHDNGLSAQECQRIDGSIAFMQKAVGRSRTVGLHWVSVSKPTNGRTVRTLADDIWKRIRRLQIEAGLKPYIAIVFETKGPHLVYLGSHGIEDRLHGHRFDGDVQFAPVTDPFKLRRAYLVKERTPQANYKRQQFFAGGRMKGSHKLPGGGDRVRLSGELQRDATAAGYIDPWRKTNAQRTPLTARKNYRPRPIVKRACSLSGQLPLLPEIEKPVTRLRDFNGGKVPPNVAREIDFRRRQLGVTQEQLAAVAGISQPQLSNGLQQRFGWSPKVVRRLREALLTPLTTSASRQSLNLKVL